LLNGKLFLEVEVWLNGGRVVDHWEERRGWDRWAGGRKNGKGLLNGVMCKLQLKVSFEIDDLVERKKVTYLKQIMVME